jgi:tetratricopeptide (TPR) repeat protein
MPRFRVSIALALAVLAPAGRTLAQDAWSWPEKGRNLQVLPKDFPAERLSSVMRGFTRALGVRCPYCHVGKERQPLSSFDFASDANPNKERAREMYRMLGDVNAHLKKIQPSGDRRVNMWCDTCHAGRPRPLTLAEDLDEAKRRAGTAAALARYRELRAKFFGKAGYDFSERSLDDYGHDLLEAKEPDAAIAVFRENANQFPASGDAWDSLGEAYLAAGKRDLARIAYSKSLELDPDNGNALAKLREIDGPSRSSGRAADR